MYTNTNVFPTGPYAPYGTNDNNFKRASVPSNNNPRYQTGSPFGNYDPMSTNMNNYYDVNTKPDKPFIDKINYKNPNSVLHNNIADHVLDEQIIEYRVHIDSLDRDIRYYDDPFHFKVKFGQLSRSIIKSETYIDPCNKSRGTKFIETAFDSSPQPYINKDFRNVKYVKLENIVLPTFNKVIEKDGDYVFDITQRLPDDRFNSLVVKELEAERTYTTYDAVTRMSDTGKYTPPRPFSLVFPDKIHVFFYTGIPVYGSRVYKNSLLENINNLSLDMYDSVGLPLQTEGIFTFDELVETPIPMSDLRHPLNKKHQVHYTFIIGVVESQINTNTKFEK